MKSGAMVGVVAMVVVGASGCESILLVAALAAAAEAGGYSGGAYTSSSEPFDTPLTGISDGHLHGDFGNVSRDSDARLSGTTYTYGATPVDRVTLETFDGTNWAMMAVEFDGGLKAAGLATGKPFRFDAYGTDSSAPVYVTAYACSDDDLSDYYTTPYDRPADAVTVTATDDPTAQVRHVAIELELPDGQVAHGKFAVPL